MADGPGGDIAGVVDRLRASRKYQRLHPDTIADVATQESANARGAKDLEARTRRRLHGAAAQFLASTSPRSLTADLERDGFDAGHDAGHDADVERWCRRAMATHASTEERLVDLDDFYPALFELIGPTDALADLACAFNVLSVPWLRRQASTTYVGYDFDLAVVELGRAFLARIGEPPFVVHADVLVTPAVVAERTAMLLKTYHCLERRRSGSGLRLVEAIGAEVVVVSLPTRSLSGRPLGFANHGPVIEARAEELGWSIRKAALSTEELWAIDKGSVDGDA